LQEEAARNLSYSNMATAKKEVIPYDMPSLEKAAGPAMAGAYCLYSGQIEKEAYEKGFEAGEKAGFAMGENKALVLIEKLESVIRDLTEFRERLIKETEPELLELAVDIAKKIVLKELTINPDEIVNITKEAMMKLERTGQITIKINPSLYDLFMKHKPDLINIHQEIVFDVDPAMPAHGTVVMGPVEDIVTDIDEQLRNIIKEIGERLACS
jgi:flagellar assembly protein FliH